MRGIWIIGKQSLQYLMKDRTAIIWFLLFPVLYIFVFGNAYRHEQDPSQFKADLTVENHDTGLLSERLIHGLQSENIQIDTLYEAPKEPPIRSLMIPDSFSQKLQRGETVSITYSKKQDANIEAGLTAEMGIRKAMIRLLADLTELTIHRRPLKNSNFHSIDQRKPLLWMNSSLAGKHQKLPHGFSQQIPAQIVQFTLIMLFVYAGTSIIDERQKGLLRRIKIAPVGFYQLFLGKMVFILLLGLIQAFLLFTIGHLLFGVYYGNAPIALILITVTFILAVGSMGLCLGFWIKNPEKIVGIAIITGLGMAAISGCWWPIEITPQWMQNLSLILPSGLAIRAFHMIISFGKGMESVWIYLISLTGIAVLFSSVFAFMLHHYQEKI